MRNFNKLKSQELLSRLVRYIVIVVIIITTLVVISISLAMEQTSQEREEEYNKQIHMTLNHVINYFFKDFSHKLEHLIQRTDFVQYIKAEDRKALYSFLKPEFERLKEETPEIEVLHVHLANGESFLRLHMPDHYGDDIASLRPMIQDIHKNHKYISGYETGLHANVYRIVAPIFDENGTYLGAFEIGLRASFLLKTVKEINGFYGAYFLKDSAKKLYRSPNKSNVIIDGYRLEGVEDDDSKRILQIIQNLNSLSTDQVIEFEGEDYLTHLLVLKDYEGKDIIKLLFFQKLQLSSHFTSTTQLFLYFGIFLIVLFSVGLIFIRIKKYQKMVSALYLKKIEEIEKLKETLELAVSGTNDGLWDWDLVNNKVYFSPRWKAMLGYKEDELENSLQTWRERVHPEDIEEAIRDIEASHRDPEADYNTIHRLRHKDGSWVWILDRGQTIFDEKKNAVRMIGFHTDITQLKKLEMEIQRNHQLLIAQSRHAEMGEMISMIAHQWRQPLSTISMGVNNLLVDIELDTLEKSSLKEELQDIGEQTVHLSKTIDDFRNFFKPGKVKNTASLKKVFFSAFRVIEKSLENNDVSVENRFEKVADVKIFERELQQVIINLLKNAKEAMEQNEVKHKKIVNKMYETQKSVFIEICDNGGGIEEHLLEKIFEPYFSTKNEKNGTGLGLYMSKMIVEKHLLGKLSVKNRDMGTCFTIEIPKEEVVKES